MNKQAAEKFAEWLAKDQPAMFVALLERANPKTVTALNDFTDLLSSIGTGLSNAVSSVGGYLSSQQGAQTLASLGAAYLTSKGAQQAVNTNLQRAQAGLGPAPIQTVYNPQTMQYEAVLPGRNGGYVPLPQPSLRSMLPASIPTWAYFAGAGFLGVIVLLSLSKR